MTNEEIKQQFAKGQKNFEQINEMLKQMSDKLDKVDTHTQSTKEIVEAWNAVKTGGKFVRWAIPILAGFGSGWLALKGWVIR